MSPGMDHPRPNTTQPRINIQFHDVTEELMVDGVLWRLMEPEHAKMIVDFVYEQLPGAGTLIVHCEAGISRSAGVAVGLARYFNLPNENEIRAQFPHFNIDVAKKIWKECQARDFSISETNL